MAREILNGSVEIQTGLWLYSQTITINNIEYLKRELYSSEGYCFYDNTWVEEERIYWQYMSLGIYSDINNYTSISISELPESLEIDGNPNNLEIA